MEILEIAFFLSSAAAMLYLLMAFLDAPPALDVKNRPEDLVARTAEAVQEIEFDFAAGKLSKSDFETARHATISELAAAMKKKDDGAPGR